MISVHRSLLAIATLVAAIFCLTAARAEMPDPADWPSVLAEAKGETVYFHA